MSLKPYYESGFPYEWIERFLTCNGKYPLNKREIGFRKNGFWIRHKEFTNLSDAEYFMNKNGYDLDDEPVKKLPLRFGSFTSLKNYMVGLIPDTIDAGTVLQSIHSDRKNPYFEKFCPLTFDVDIKDYIGKTCKCTTTCDECWITYARPALIDLTTWLRDFMKFEKILPVDSGNGGFHVYVLDARVWSWDQEARLQFYGFLPKSVVLDRSVENSFIHLVKVPFSPNPKSGYLSLPIVNIQTYLPRYRIRSYKEKAFQAALDYAEGITQ